jgi:hypothetical protein
MEQDADIPIPACPLYTLQVIRPRIDALRLRAGIAGLSRVANNKNPRTLGLQVSSFIPLQASGDSGTPFSLSWSMMFWIVLAAMNTTLTTLMPVTFIQASHSTRSMKYKDNTSVANFTDMNFNSQLGIMPPPGAG